MSLKTENLNAALAGLIGEDAVCAPEGANVAGVAPRVVVRPADVGGVQKVLAYANENGLKVVPTGNGTKLELGNPPEEVDILLELTRLDQVTEYDAENLTIAAQAGVKVRTIDEKVARDGLFFPVDPSFPLEATIGGVVATGDNGPKRFGHGNLRDVVLGVKMVRTDGELVKFGGRTIKNVSGYDVTKLLIGSYGTLGVIVEATFRLLPEPQREDVLLHAFPRLEDAAKLSAEVLDSVLIPTAMELISPKARPFLGINLPEEFAPGEHVLAVGLEGHPDAVLRQERDLTAMCSNLAPNRTALISGGGYLAEGAEPAPGEAACHIHEDSKACNCSAISDQATVDSLWDSVAEMRRTAAAAGFDVAAKVAVPISVVWELAEALEKSADANGIETAYRISAPVGILTFYLKGDAAKKTAVLEDLRTLAEKRDGSLVLRSAPTFDDGIDAWGNPGPEISVMRAIKAKYDPNRILNAGRFVGRI
ncbi:MAG: FAD-binding oxidoreductase [Thermoleophilia bacterium]